MVRLNIVFGELANVYRLEGCGGTADRDYVDLEEFGFVCKNQVDTTHCILMDSAHVNSPFYKLEVREAVEYAINRERLAKAFSYGYWKPVYQIPTETCPAYNPDFTLALKPSC